MRKRFEYDENGFNYVNAELPNKIDEIAEQAAETVIKDIGKDYIYADLENLFMSAMRFAFTKVAMQDEYENLTKKKEGNK